MSLYNQPNNDTKLRNQLRCSIAIFPLDERFLLHTTTLFHIDARDFTHKLLVEYVIQLSDVGSWIVIPYARSLHLHFQNSRYLLVFPLASRLSFPQSVDVL
jgi:hypothetical protein